MKILSLQEISNQVRMALPPVSMTTKIIAIDGCGGAGKSTLANRLSKHLNNCSVIHTDDFASWDNSLSWYPRMIDEVFNPLSKNIVANYQRYDWVEKRLANWIRVEPQEFVIIEGVSSSRKEFRDFLSFSIFVKTQRDLRLQRGLERDGIGARDQWLKWMRQEDQYIQRDDPETFVNLVVSGELESFDGSADSVLVLNHHQNEQSG